MSQNCGPTLAGFNDFIYATPGPVQFNPLELPTNNLVITIAYNVAFAQANQALACLGGGPSGPSIYALAVYNLATSLIINFAQDQAGRTYFTDLRVKLNLVQFQPGLVASTGDSSTSTSLLNQEFMRNLTINDLQRLKDPYGRQYLMFAQAYGPTLVGIS